MVYLEDLYYKDAGIHDIPNSISGQKVTFIIVPFLYETQGALTRLVWLYRKANFTLLKENISNFDWFCLNEDTLDETCNNFTDATLKKS